MQEIPENLVMMDTPPTMITLDKESIYMGEYIEITLLTYSDSLVHSIGYSFAGELGEIEYVSEKFKWRIPPRLNDLIPFKDEEVMGIYVDTYKNGLKIGRSIANVRVKRSKLPETFPTPNIDDKVIIFDKFDVNFERPLSITNRINSLKIKEELNGAFEMSMNASHEESSRHIEVGNYVQVLGDIFKIKSVTRSRSKGEISVDVECEHVYFELLDDYIEKADVRTVNPVGFAKYINQFTSFNLKVDEDILANLKNYPTKRITISRGTPIKSINRMVEQWGLDIKRFRRDIIITDGLNKDKLQLFKHQKNITSLKREDEGGQLTTRLHLIGLEGLTIDGLDIKEIPYQTKTNKGTTTIINDEGIVLCTVQTVDGFIVDKFIDSKFINLYPIPKNGEIVDGAETKLDLILKGIEELNAIDSTTTSYSIDAMEFGKYAGEIEKFGLGYTAIIQDEELMRDHEYNLVQSRIVEYEYSPFEPASNSSIKLGYNDKGALSFFNKIEEVSNIVTENSDSWNETIEKVEKIETKKFLLSWDSNEQPIVVDKDEVEIASVSINMPVDSDGQGQLLVNLISNNESTLIIRVYDNETQELYSPIVQQIRKGNSAIGIPHGYFGKAQGVHNLSVTAQSITGAAYIQPHGVTYDVETIAPSFSNLIMDAGDISIKNPAVGGDKEVYIIGKDKDEDLVISKTVYINNMFYGEEDFETLWSMPELGTVRNLMIEFNGEFQLPRGKDIYTLITQEKPWIFWINEENELWGQYGDEVVTAILLAEGVLQASAVKGWSLQGSESIDEDMGLVVSYVKYDGVIAYKQLRGLKVLSSTTQATWSTERILTEAGKGNKEVFINRLNDYRMAFSVNGVDKVFITKRLFVGQASPKEVVNINNKISDYMTLITVIPTKKIPYELQPTMSTKDNRVFKLVAPYKWDIRGSVRSVVNSVTNESDANLQDVYVNEENEHELIFVMDKEVGAGTMSFMPDPYHIIGNVNGTRLEIDKEILVFNVVYRDVETVEFTLKPSIDLEISVYTPPEDFKRNENDIASFTHTVEPVIIVTKIGAKESTIEDNVDLNLTLSISLEALRAKDIIG